MNEKFIMETVDNLQTESEQLNVKMKKAREDENWGTYKNIVQAYEKILDLLSRYNVKPIKVVNLEDEICEEYNKDSPNTNRILCLIKEEYNINENDSLSPEQEYKFSQLLNKCLIKLLDKEIYRLFKNDTEIKHGKDTIDFLQYNDEGFVVENNDSITRQCDYIKVLSINLKESKIDIGITFNQLLNNEYNLFIFLKKIIKGYIHAINNLTKQLDEAYNSENKVRDNFYLIKIGLGDYFTIKNYDDYMNVKFKFNVGLINKF